MENVKNQNPDQKKGQGAQKGKKQQNKKFDMEARIKQNIENAQKREYAVVPRRAIETGTMQALMSKNDFLVDQLHKKIGVIKGVDSNKALELIQRNVRIHDEVNKINSEICAVLGLEYKPPRGFEDTVKSNKAPEPGSENEEARAVNS